MVLWGDKQSFQIFCSTKEKKEITQITVWEKDVETFSQKKKFRILLGDT